jgi:hypothetical protein
MNYFLFFIRTFQKESKVYIWMLVIVFIVLFLLIRFVDMYLNSLDLLHRGSSELFQK